MDTRIIGKRERRVDILGKLTGLAKFAADYNAGHQLYGKVLRAKHPHARILNIDTSKAKMLDGVEAVLTAQDIPGEKVMGIVIKNQAILAFDKVRYLGDGVALVAARTKDVAEEALNLIRVDYEPLPVVSDPEEALKPDAPKIHGNDNAFVHHKVRKGDVEKGFAQTDFVIERKFRTPCIEHSYIEPEAVLAEPAEHGGVLITGSVQNLFSSRRSVAAALKLDLNRVQIIQATLGGSFGGKDEVMTSMCCRAALLALATGKPVKMVNSREESMLESYKRHPYVLYYKWGAKKDGSITAMQCKCIADGGAYSSMSPFVTWRSVVQATGPYYCENVKTDVHAAYTNNNYTGAMRGFGSPQVNFAIESMMDELAEKVGKDPLQIRLQNGFKTGAVTATGQKLTHNVSLLEVLTKAAEAGDFLAKWKKYRSAPDAPKKRGIGLACSYRGVSLGAEGVDAAGTIVSVQTDGSVIVSSGITDMGQGAQTQMSQIAAEVLGISMSRIRFMNTNTSRVPDSGPTVASRGTIMGGSAAKKAAEIVRETLLGVGAILWMISSSKRRPANGWPRSPNSPPPASPAANRCTVWVGSKRPIPPGTRKRGPAMLTSPSFTVRMWPKWRSIPKPARWTSSTSSPATMSGRRLTGILSWASSMAASPWESDTGSSRNLIMRIRSRSSSISMNTSSLRRWMFRPSKPSSLRTRMPPGRSAQSLSGSRPLSLPRPLSAMPSVTPSASAFSRSRPRSSVCCLGINCRARANAGLPARKLWLWIPASLDEVLNETF